MFEVGLVWLELGRMEPNCNNNWDKMLILPWRGMYSSVIWTVWTPALAGHFTGFMKIPDFSMNNRELICSTLWKLSGLQEMQNQFVSHRLAVHVLYLVLISCIFRNKIKSVASVAWDHIGWGLVKLINWAWKYLSEVREAACFLIFCSQKSMTLDFKEDLKFCCVGVESGGVGQNDEILVGGIH